MDEITVVIEGEDSDAAASSSMREIEAVNRQADADRAKAARLNLQTAHLRREADLRSVDSSLLTAQSELKAAESQYESARELGDVSAEKEAVRRLTAAEVRRSNFEQQAAMLQRMPVSSGDQFEDHVSRFTDKTAQWMREHRDWVENTSRNAKLIGAHHMAVGDGLEPDTPEYFAHVERQLGIRSGGNGNGSARSGSMQQRGSSNINPNDVNTHVQGNGIYLTAGERKTATDGTLRWSTGPRKGEPLGVQEYARRKQEMIRQRGWYDKI